MSAAAGGAPGVERSSGRTEGASTLWMRVAGAALGGSLTAVAVEIAPWTNDGALVAAPIRLTAIATGSVLGLLVGAAAVRASRPAGFVVLQSSRAVVLTVTAWLLAALLMGRIDEGRELAILAGYAFVLPFAFLLGLPLTLPVAGIATTALRFAARRPLPGAVVIVVLVGSASALAVLRPNLADAVGAVVSTAPSSREELRWTVVNRSQSDLVLGVWTRESDGYGGSTLGVPGCQITAGSTDAGESWFVSLDREEPLDTEPIPVLEASDTAGARAVWLEVAADGTVTGIAGREPPPVDSTLVDACGPAVTP